MHRFNKPTIQRVSQFLKQAINPLQPIELETARTLWDFSIDKDKAEWNVTSDAAFGGLSKASLTAAPDSIVFEGHLSQAIPPGSKIERSGFAAIRSRKYPKHPFQQHIMRLDRFDAAEFLIRGDGRTYIANLQTESLQDEDIYQQFFYTKGGAEWERIILPFNKFLLTYRGYVQNEQRGVNSSGIRTFGVSLIDGLDGPFRLEIKQIRAIYLADKYNQKPDNFPDEHIKSSYGSKDGGNTGKDK